MNPAIFENDGRLDVRVDRPRSRREHIPGLKESGPEYVRTNCASDRHHQRGVQWYAPACDRDEMKDQEQVDSGYSYGPHEPMDPHDFNPDPPADEAASPEV